jgi:hypothetical protein
MSSIECVGEYSTSDSVPSILFSAQIRHYWISFRVRVEVSVRGRDCSQSNNISILAMVSTAPLYRRSNIALDMVILRYESLAGTSDITRWYQQHRVYQDHGLPVRA